MRRWSFQFPRFEFTRTRIGSAWLVFDYDDGARLARSQSTHTVWHKDEFKILKKLAKPRPVEAIAAVKRVFPGSWILKAWRVGDTARPSRGWGKSLERPEEWLEEPEE